MREIHYQHEGGALPPTLQSVPFLQQLDGEMLDKVLTNTVVLECERGDVIIQEGDDSNYFCILLKGTVDVTKGSERVARIDGAGEMLGELALLNGENRSASVVAATHAFCLRVEPKFLSELSDTGRHAFYAVLYRFVAGLLSERLDACSKRLATREDELRQIREGKFKL